MKVLLFGAGGQLGRTLVSKLPEIFWITPSKAEADLRDPAAVGAAVEGARADRVINAAAYTDVDGAESDPETAFAVNAEGAGYVSAAASRAGLPVVYISSDYVFDGRAGRAYVEDDAPAPLSVYGASKREGEVRTAEANPAHLIVRTAWLYSLAGRNFARTILDRAAGGSLSVVDDQRGSPTYAPHLAQALGELIAEPVRGVRHLAGAGAASWYELAVELCRRAAPDCRVEPVPTSAMPRPAPRPACSVLESRGGRALPPWRDGAAEFSAGWLELQAPST